uniref:Uncharacterized protein n=1 Tax=viral metagenome TaxID=1070528 RepID=A0A6C0KZ77_9ZZZZ
MEDNKEHTMLKYDAMLNKLYLYNEGTIPFYPIIIF